MEQDPAASAVEAMTPPDPQRVEIKSCPFCGAPGMLAEVIGTYVRCSDPDRECAMTRRTLPLKCWNSRAVSSADAIQPTRREEVRLRTVAAELQTLGNALVGLRNDFNALMEVWPPSKRGSRAQRHLDNILGRIDGADLCQRDADAALTTTTDGAGGATP